MWLTSSTLWQKKCAPSETRLSLVGEVIGRADLLKVRDNVTLTKTQSSTWITQLPDTRENREWLSHEVVHTNGVVWMTNCWTIRHSSGY